MQPSSILLCPRPSLAASQRPGLAPTLIHMSKLRVDRDNEFWRGHWPHWQRKSSRHGQWQDGRARRERKAAPIGEPRTGKRFRMRCRPRAAAKGTLHSPGARVASAPSCRRPRWCSCRRSREGHYPSSSRPASHCARRGLAAATTRPARGGERNIDSCSPQQRHRPHRCGCNWSGEWTRSERFNDGARRAERRQNGRRGGHRARPREIPGGPTRMSVAFASSRA
jgi:hypothetical protein